MPFDLVLALESEHYSMIEIINIKYKEKYSGSLESLNNGQQFIGASRRYIKQKFNH